MFEIKTIEDVQAAIRQTDAIAIRGGGSKSALHATNEQAVLDLSGLTGILEYEPGEYTFTALAGTPLQTVAAALAEHGQYLPFDPPLLAQGATLGGTVAAGLSGAGRYRYGGVRDFLIGVRFVDGQGRLVRGGGKVVKNAAGFDLPKLMVGSLGQFGVMVEVSFKVFPEPESYRTLALHYRDLAAAQIAMQRAIDSHFDLYALDLAVNPTREAPYQLLLRLGGSETVLPQRIAQIRQLLDDAAIAASEEQEGDEEATGWRAANGFQWHPADHTLVKVATTPGKLASLDSWLAAHNAQRRYTVGGNLAYIAWPGALSTLHQELAKRELAGLALLGAAEQPLLGKQQSQTFVQRIKSALDPDNRLPTYTS